MSTWAIFFVTVLLGTHGASAAESTNWDAIERRLNHHAERTLRSRTGVGIVVGVVRGNESRIWSFGETKVGNGTLPTASHLFEIGSITKTFTTTLLALMVERGQVRLDDAIELHWPQLLGTDAGKITLCELATHTSGLPRLPPNFAPAVLNNPYGQFDREQLLQDLLSHQTPQFKPHHYSNLGMAVLGHVLSDSIHHREYYDLLRSEVLLPMQMTQTLESVEGLSSSWRASGHSGALEPVPNWTFLAMSPAGSLLSNGNDLVKSLQFHLSPPDTELGRATRLARRAHANINNGAHSAMGLGWYLLELSGRKFVQHDGGTGGFRSNLMLEEETQTGAFILANTALMPDCLMAAVFDLPCTPRSWADLDEAQLQRWVGTYHSVALNLSVHVRSERGIFTIQPDGQPPLRVFPASETEFLAPELAITIQFNDKSEDQPRWFELVQNGQSVRFADATTKRSAAE